MNLSFWKKEKVTTNMFFGPEHNYGWQVLEDELKDANCDLDKVNEIVEFVKVMMVAHTHDVLEEAKRIGVL